MRWKRDFEDRWYQIAPMFSFIVSMAVLLVTIFLVGLAGCAADVVDEAVSADEPAAGIISLEDIQSADESALVGLGYSGYSYPVWDRENGVCYLLTSFGGQVALTPRYNPDGSLMVVLDE